MDSASARFLLIHGSIVLLVGLLTGIPFWVAIIRGRESGVVGGWRVAHATLIACGLLILVVGVASPHLVLSPGFRAFLERAFVASGYSFAFPKTGMNLPGLPNFPCWNTGRKKAVTERSIIPSPHLWRKTYLFWNPNRSRSVPGPTIWS